MSAADRAAWQEYVTLECQAFYSHCEGETYIWKTTPAASRMIARLTGTRAVTEYVDEYGRKRSQLDYVGGDSLYAAFSGPWHVVRPHLTTEFVQWVEEYEGTRRLTFSEWRAARAAERRELDYADTADYTLGRLVELRRLIAERDSIILEAANRGASKVAIAEAVGISRQQVHATIAAAELAPVIPIRPAVADLAPIMTASGEVAF